MNNKTEVNNYPYGVVNILVKILPDLIWYEHRLLLYYKIIVEMSTFGFFIPALRRMAVVMSREGDI